MERPRSFGAYQLIKRIAAGGMAEIFLAKTAGIAGFEKHLAVKMIRENLSNDHEFIEMLVNEAKIAVRLNHTNIVQIFDLGRIDDRYYITMEYVDGRDLHAVLVETAKRDTYAPFDAAAYIIREACAGLHYAHDRLDDQGRPLNIIHRDVSPQNILVSYGGAVKITDFGIAKANIDRSETQIGILKGKFCYMSPEQAWGDKLDRRSDVFSLGVVLYELLTGEMLYQDEDQLKLLDNVRRANIQPPTAVRRDIPSELEAITMQALERDRKDRFESAAVFHHELSRYLATSSPGYTQADFARYMQSLFEGAIEQSAEESRARNQALETRNVALPAAQVMARNEYVPDQASSLVHSFSALRAVARQTEQPAPAPQEVTSAARPRGPKDSTRPLLAPPQRRLNDGHPIEPSHAPVSPSPGYGGTDFEEDEPTQAYSPEEIRRAVNTGLNPVAQPVVQQYAQVPEPAWHPAPGDEWEAPTTQVPPGWRASVLPPSDDSIELASADLMPVSVHDQAQHGSYPGQRQQGSYGEQPQRASYPELTPQPSHAGYGEAQRSYPNMTPQAQLPQASYGQPQAYAEPSRVPPSGPQASFGDPNYRSRPEQQPARASRKEPSQPRAAAPTPAGRRSGNPRVLQPREPDSADVTGRVSDSMAKTIPKIDRDDGMPTERHPERQMMGLWLVVGAIVLLGVIAAIVAVVAG